MFRDLDGANATVADYSNALGIDNKLRQTAGGTPSYFLTDHLRTTRSLTDASGSVSPTLSYDSFGNVTGGSAPSRFTYTGRESDQDTNVLYYRARWYNPKDGRFTSMDPIGFWGSDINLYVYVKNNPAANLEPNGTIPIPAAAAVAVTAAETYLHDRLAQRAKDFTQTIRRDDGNIVMSIACQCAFMALIPFGPLSQA